MRTARELLSQYAAYHRDRRNIATHFVGIPMIVFSVAELLARLPIGGPDSPVSAAVVMWVLTTVFYLSRHVVVGVATSLAVGLAVVAGHAFAHAQLVTWLSVGIGSFVVGWVIQFVGHYYEGRKPAFVDDVIGLIIGPLFVAAEVAFAMGLRKEVQHAVEAKVGPTLLRQMKVA